ncbi:GNAT family N-acetyltransferase [Acetobacteraceae bacterium H6797]|nr:GNAT family N-acetyltransferase [Acetobacteraceae bacterium H6797]
MANLTLVPRDEPATTIAVDVTFLRMARRPDKPARPLPEGVSIQRVARCTVGFYRYLYATVGQDYVWWLRRTVSDADLAATLADPAISVHVLYQGGEPAGFFELERRPGGVVNLSYFGLMPHAIGKGLGGPFLRAAVDTAWAEATAAVTVNTCTADHERALPNYIATGFVTVQTIREVWRVPQRLGLPIPDRLKIR